MLYVDDTPATAQPSLPQPFELPGLWKIDQATAPRCSENIAMRIAMRLRCTANTRHAESFRTLP